MKTAKTAKSVRNSLKFKAKAKPGLLTVRVGVKKYVIPVEARLLTGGDFMFLSFPASIELYKIEGKKKLAALGDNDDAASAFESLNPGRRSRKAAGGGRSRGGQELPSELAAALSGIPKGYRLGYGPDGTPRLVKKRTRKSK